VSRYQKSKTNLDFTEARDSEWQWNQLGHMQVCISLHTENHTNTPPLKKVFYRPDALPAAGDTLSEGVQLMELLVEQLDRTNSVKALKANLSPINTTHLPYTPAKWAIIRDH